MHQLEKTLDSPLDASSLLLSVPQILMVPIYLTDKDYLTHQFKILDSQIFMLSLVFTILEIQINARRIQIKNGDDFISASSIT